MLTLVRCIAKCELGNQCNFCRTIHSVRKHFGFFNVNVRIHKQTHHKNLSPTAVCLLSFLLKRMNKKREKNNGYGNNLKRIAQENILICY